MDVTNITLSLRYSKELPGGSWKAIEVGAEATPDPNRDWREQQRELYTELAASLQELFNGNGKSPTNEAGL